MSWMCNELGMFVEFSNMKDLTAEEVHILEFCNENNPAWDATDEQWDLIRHILYPRLVSMTPYTEARGLRWFALTTRKGDLALRVHYAVKKLMSGVTA